MLGVPSCAERRQGDVTFPTLSLLSTNNVPQLTAAVIGEILSSSAAYRYLHSSLCEPSKGLTNDKAAAAVGFDDTCMRCRRGITLHDSQRAGAEAVHHPLCPSAASFRGHEVVYQPSGKALGHIQA